MSEQGQGTMTQQRARLDQGSQSGLRDSSNFAGEAHRLADGLQCRSLASGDATRQASRPWEGDQAVKLRKI